MKTIEQRVIPRTLLMQMLTTTRKQTPSPFTSSRSGLQAISLRAAQNEIRVLKTEVK
jgi:hypothetical protein